MAELSTALQALETSSMTPLPAAASDDQEYDRWSSSLPADFRPAAPEIYRNIIFAKDNNIGIKKLLRVKLNLLFLLNLHTFSPFLINFPQRSGALKEFVVDILHAEDDITHFEYIKRNNRSSATALEINKL